MSVISSIDPLVIPTYPVGAPEKNPVFFEKRVYQGSNGKVYPLPFIDKVFDDPLPTTYQSARLENEFIRLVMLPEIGGRIFLGQDKTNGDHDFFYRQDVIKPALVGLAGPWISGGVEFNWPQHHRPGTFMPTDVHIEHEADGAVTVWMSEHDPLDRMKGMHGIRLRPGSSLIELRARLYNRTPFTRTFLWWANVAAMVHDQYQSFFPPDVHYVADHAVRALSSFPIANNPYYGVDYQNHAGANDLGWYKNIPVPTSYMVCQTGFDFFGGYDFSANGGFVHIADRHIAPGKKQWTWGNHPFGWAWDRELTDANGPYIELMAGVYTDNQPDFSYLLPYETKTFSQFWWPIRDIGPVQQANTKAALALAIRDDRKIVLGLNVSEAFEGALVIFGNHGVLGRFDIALKPGAPWTDESLRFDGENPAGLLAQLRHADGSLVFDYRPVDISTLTRDRAQATEPPAAEEIDSADELYFTAEHLEQYRHPTRDPEPYLRRCLEIDPLDARANLALGKRHLSRGQFAEARVLLESAIARLTARHPNPVTGEAHHFLGLTLRFLGDGIAAETLFAKAAWNYEWRSSSHYQLATLACRRGDFARALHHLDESLATNRDHNKAQTLQALALQRLSRNDEALAILDALLATDPLDHWATVAADFIRQERIQIPAASRNDAQTILDLVFDFDEAGFTAEAIALIDAHHATAVEDCAVPNPLISSQMTRYVKAWLTRDPAHLSAAREQSPDYFFPSRLQEMLVLEWAGDPLASYALGNLYYDKRRHHDAIAAWEMAESSDIPQVHRNLAIARWNVHRDADAARAGYLKAIKLDPADPRLVSEFDQLRAKLNDPLEDRLAFLQEKRELVLQRDDASVALATLLNLLDRPQRALDLLLSRRFHPWEGGEGSVIRQFTTAKILLGRRALEAGDPAAALDHFQSAMETPDSLGEKYHLLQAKADLNYWIGRNFLALGQETEARAAFEASANEAGDFAEMTVTAHSPLSWLRGLSLRALGRETEATVFFRDLLTFASSRIGQPAKIDYFATSLPNLLVFDEDLQRRRDSEHRLLAALAHHGLGHFDESARLLSEVITFNRADQRALDLSHELETATTPA
jgi:tetratricopeptide (TPR) repeat protein